MHAANNGMKNTSTKVFETFCKQQYTFYQFTLKKQKYNGIDAFGYIFQLFFIQFPLKSFHL